jgi:CubicO group peptidase (beta-lactamase class C family)
MKPAAIVLTLFAAGLGVAATGPAAPQNASANADALPGSMTRAIDAAVADVLKSTGAPSASIGVVRDGRLAYTRAYGDAQLQPKRAATPEMRYSIGSISKQFTAAAVLLLAQDDKLRLDDKVSKWLPDLTRADEVSIRQLLSMTAGYQDFWPQDYVMPAMLKDAGPDDILQGWARKPLDFDPGTRWQYSNTNYTIAGLIVEKTSGQRLFDFLRERIFSRLGMASVFNSDQAALPPTDAMRYRRFALAPAREAPKEGRGWMFGAAELAMTARDLAAWDLAMIDRSALSPASYAELEREVLLTSGAPTGYGLGVDVAVSGGRRRISHTGEVSGFTARNNVYPDDRAAIVVLTNLDATGASSQIASRIETALFDTAGATSDDTAAATAQARRMFEELQRGRLDRSLLTANLSAYFSEQALADFRSSLGRLGAPSSFRQTVRSLRGGMVFRRFEIVCGRRTLALTTFTVPDGRLEQYLVSGVD